jgi:1-acyl-sn-glycerol-3-phosphate acyltransferase
MKILYYSGWTLTRVLSKTLFRIKVRGKENFPESGGFILATNHRSYYDPLLVGSWAPRQVYFLAKQELFKSWFFGRIITATNALPVRRGTIDRNALKLCVETLENGYGLTIFPEGTRAKGKEFLDPKPGVGVIATQAKVPIVPGYVHGSDRLNDCFKGRVKMSIHFGEPIPAEQVAGFPIEKQGYLELTQLVMDRIKLLKQQVLSAQ